MLEVVERQEPEKNLTQTISQQLEQQMHSYLSARNYFEVLFFCVLIIKYKLILHFLRYFLCHLLHHSTLVTWKQLIPASWYGILCNILCRRVTLLTSSCILDHCQKTERNRITGILVEKVCHMELCRISLEAGAYENQIILELVNLVTHL